MKPERSRKAIAQTLGCILHFYECERSVTTPDEAKRSTMDAYDDLYDWINRLGDFKKVKK